VGGVAAFVTSTLYKLVVPGFALYADDVAPDISDDGLHEPPLYHWYVNGGLTPTNMFAVSEAYCPLLICRLVRVADEGTIDTASIEFTDSRFVSIEFDGLPLLSVTITFA
jgi:hypothetical protein